MIKKLLRIDPIDALANNSSTDALKRKKKEAQNTTKFNYTLGYCTSSSSIYNIISYIWFPHYNVVNKEFSL